MRKLIFFIAFSMLQFGCSRPRYVESTGKGIKIQVMGPKQENDVLSFQVRIFQTNEVKHQQLLEEKMSYEMDKSFYLVENGQKIYPQQVQRISNGIAKTYEYLIFFDGETLPGGEIETLGFYDKYLTGKEYQLGN